MDKKKILIIENSEIIQQGLGAILCSRSYQFETLDTLSGTNLQTTIKKTMPDVVIINPALSADSSGEKIKQLRQAAINNNFQLVALVYAFFDNDLLESFDEVISINDDAHKIALKLKSLLSSYKEDPAQEENATLSQREIEVIRLIAFGHSNKEIAEKLSISIHTVISHRKNITVKLGIKSASGLAIYAVINKLINSEDFENTI